MATKRRKRRKLCPEGVMRECMYCIQSKGKIWLILDPKGTTIDEASEQKMAMNIADGYVSQCVAASSGYGGKTEFSTDGEFKWERLGQRRAGNQA